MHRVRSPRLLAVAIVAALAAAGAGGQAPAVGAAARPDPLAAAIAAAAAKGTISAGQAATYGALYAAARAAIHPLGGVRKRELKAVLAIVRGVAARGALTGSRMPLVFLTLQRNVEWWSAHEPPAPGSAGEPGVASRRCKPFGHAAAGAAATPTARAARVSFPGSGIQWEYYRGMGLQLQVNGTFAAANALLRQNTPATLPQAGAILGEMVGLASQRSGLTTWEYAFPFGGGKPPWTSALSQATAIEAYTNAAAKLNRPDYLELARRLAALFAARPSAGVLQRLARDGNWYLLYDFDSHQRVLNAQLDALIALHDLAAASGDPNIAYLEREGMRATRRRIASFDTGRWSRYAEGGPIADLNYHVLNRDLARSLCERTAQGAICDAWHSFARELEARCPRTPKPTPPTPPAPQQPGETPPSAGPAPPPGQAPPPPAAPLLPGAVTAPS